jgi:hypothetical protein
MYLPYGGPFKMRYDSVPITIYSGGLPYSMHVCQDCGALIVDADIHNEWHNKTEDYYD